MLPAAAGVAAIGGLLAWLLASQTGFAPGACPRAEAYLAAHVVGQDLAVRQLSDAVCSHLAKPRPGRPLVVSAHGPPGVGKTLTHQLLARALYSASPSDALECPGRDCPGYKVMYGMDYLANEAEGRLAALRRELLEHVRAHPEALVVVEEYDKLDCGARALWRQLLQHPERANVTWDRAIVMLESNLGMAALEQLLAPAPAEGGGGGGSGGGSDSDNNLADIGSSNSSSSSSSSSKTIKQSSSTGSSSGNGGRAGVSAEAAERALKEVIFSHWQRGGCEGFEDTLKFTALVDFYLPYFPLARPHVEELTARALAARAPALARDKGLRLEWRAGAVDFLVSKVEFAGEYPLEGAKGVEASVTRHVARLLRHAPARGGGKDGGGGKGGGSGGGDSAAAQPSAALMLSVSGDGRELVATVMDDGGSGVGTDGSSPPLGNQAAAAAAAAA